MNQVDKIRRAINDSFAERLHTALAVKFPDLKVETDWSLMSMALVTRPTSRKQFTVAQRDFIGAFEAGYGAAQKQVRA